MIKVLTVIGTRPEAIKLAPVIAELERRPHEFVSLVCASGQHRELVDPMLDLFGIRPEHDLDVMRPGQSLTQLTRSVLQGVDKVIALERPDWVLVQGDTTTVMATTLAAFHHRASVGHVEAGLRTFDKYSPFPEEINRRVAGVVADLHFAPTEWAADNLRREGVPHDRIFVTGNTVIDALHQVADMEFDPAGTPLERLPVGRRRIALVTAHRQESFGDGIVHICTAIRVLAERHPDVHFVYPVHLNPKVRGPAYEHLSGCANVSLLPPLEYQPLVWLLKRSHLVITDSGGLQEEAAGIGVPVLVLRETTERPEGVSAGIARLVGAHRDTIVPAATHVLGDDLEHAAMAAATCPYGTGDAAFAIVEALLGRRATQRAADHLYEVPMPQHPLDALLHEATDQVQPQSKRRRRADFPPAAHTATQPTQPA